MNKIIMFLILTTFAFPAYVTFNVDMSAEDIEDEAVFLWMGFYYPDPGFAMTDSDGDGIWTTSLYLSHNDGVDGTDPDGNPFGPGTYTYKYRVGDWPEWNTGGGWDDITGQDCAVGQWNDRYVVVEANDMVLDPVCWGSCAGGDCQPGEIYDVTFQLDMNDVDGFEPATGVYVNIQPAWCGLCNLMSDDDGDGIWTLTLSMEEGIYQYIYLVPEWDEFAGGAPLNSGCDYVQGDAWPNYGFNLSGGDLTLDLHSFGECPEGTAEASIVTFDIDGVDDCGFVSVSGTFDGWSGWGATMDTNMEAAVAPGEHGFKVLCVDTLIPEWYNDIWAASCILTAPCGSECDLDPFDEFNHYGFSIGSETTLTVSYCAGTCDATCDGTDPTYCDGDECSCDDPGCGEEDCVCDSCPPLGDLNGDGVWNVQDIVILSSCVLNTNCAVLDVEVGYGCAGDINEDTYFNVLDIVTLANCILSENCGGRVLDASHSKLIMDNNVVSIEADGFIGGVQMTLTHGADFAIEMTDRALLADYLTTGNETRLLVITPETEELFIYSGDFEITEIIVANTQYEVSVDLPLAASFSLSDAYPNPFNPATTMTLAMPVSGDMQVEVYNLLGQVVATLANGYMDAGTYSLTWDANDVSSGMYFVKAQADGFTATQKLMLVK